MFVPPIAPQIPLNPMISHLQLELEWLKALLETRIREMQAVGLLPGAEKLRPGTVIYPQEVEARLHANDEIGIDPTSDEIEANQRLAVVEKRRNAYYKRYTQFDTSSPLAFLRQQFHLNDAQYLLLLMVVAPAFDPSFSRAEMTEEKIKKYFMTDEFYSQYLSEKSWFESKNPRHEYVVSHDGLKLAALVLPFDKNDSQEI